jgi:predicted DsbA family dithiol-disulfide isomerase
MNVEIWSDVVCPWCYIGKRRFETALSRFPHADDVDVAWRSFELDPAAPRRREGDLVEHLARKYGIAPEQARAKQAQLTHLAAQEGLDFRFDIAQPGNTLDAHRLLHLAADHGRQGAVKEGLLAAYLTDGAPIGEPDTLARVATGAGLGSADVHRVLDSDAYLAEVRADERQATELGITGVPFFVVDRKYAVSGAQPPEVLLGALERAWSETSPLVVAGGGAASCDGDSCPT